MHKSFRTIILILAVLLATPQLYAHQPKRGKVIATAGPIFFQRYVDRDYPGVENPLGAGFFIAAEGDVDKHGGLEITLGYMKKRYFKKEAGSLLVEEIKRVQTSTGYRHWFTPKWSAALGIFTSYSIGDVGTIEDSRAPGWKKFETAAQKQAEDGLEFSFQHEFITKKNFGVLVDLKYSYSFSAHDNESPNVYGVMIGYKQFIQGNEPDSSLLNE